MKISDFDRSSQESLQTFFAKNSRFPAFYEKASPYERATLWTSCERILTQASALQIRGIQEKLADAPTVIKLIRILSEIHIAVEFGNRGFQVELIPDNSRGWNNTPPDLTLTCDGFSARVEVTRWEGDGTSSLIYELLSPILETQDLVLCYSLSTELSKIVVDNKDRTTRDKQIEIFVTALKVFIKNLDRSTLPIRKNIQGTEIQLEASDPGWGRVGSSNTSACIVPQKAYEEQLLFQLKKKAKKPKEWPLAQQQQPYFIAVDTQETVGQKQLFPRYLYGGYTSVSYMDMNERRSPAMEYPPIVAQRLDTNWRDFLLALGFDSSCRAYISSLGFFLSEPEAANVCGVLLLHYGTLTYYPNPFANSALLRSDYDQLLRVPIDPLIAQDYYVPK